MDSDSDPSLNSIKARIEKMGVPHQKEVLRLLSLKSYIPVSENQNGSFINLSNLKKSDIEALTNYVNYVEEQQLCLAEGERVKKGLREEFFNEDKAYHSNMG